MLPLYPVGEVNWLTSQALYHGLPVLGEEGVILCWPKESYVSLGCHQDWDEFDESSNIPAIRRQVGGSLVYLDNQQVFFQVIADPSKHPRLKTPEQWYHFALYPVIASLKHLGFEARFKAPADILVDDRKISGNAGGQIEDSAVVVGNILLEFSPANMARVRAGSTLLKGAFAEAMARHLVTLNALTAPGRVWTREEVMRLLARFFHQEMGAEIQDSIPWDRWDEVLDQTGKRLLQPEWLHAAGYRPPYHQVKVREGVYLRQTRRDRYPEVIAEVNTESKVITALWNCPVQFSLPLNAAGIGEQIQDSPLRLILYELLDVRTKDPMLS